MRLSHGAFESIEEPCTCREGPAIRIALHSHSIRCDECLIIGYDKCNIAMIYCAYMQEREERSRTEGVLDPTHHVSFASAASGFATSPREVDTVRQGAMQYMRLKSA